VLSASEPARLTKKQGDALTYLRWPNETNAALTEVQFSVFQELTHSYCLRERPAFEHEDELFGPMLVEERDSVSLLAAYEHGSTYPDKYVCFVKTENETAIRAVKGNYWSGRRVTPGNPYVTIWLDFARVEGDEDDMASAFRDFQLRGVAPHSASRKPWIFYNTWASQERDHWWGGSRRFLNLMGEKRILEDIDRAAEMGIDVFVIDTGWYEKTGDWRVSTERFPHGFKPVTDRLA
jgi:alpha-galactosidase